MHERAEAVVGIATGTSFLVGVVALGQQSASATLRIFSVLAGIGGGGAIGIFAALATHLARGPAAYEPLEGDASAWGLAEVDDARR